MNIRQRQPAPAREGVPRPAEEEPLVLGKRLDEESRISLRNARLRDREVQFSLGHFLRQDPPVADHELDADSWPLPGEPPGGLPDGDLGGVGPHPDPHMSDLEGERERHLALQFRRLPQHPLRALHDHVPDRGRHRARPGPVEQPRPHAALHRLDAAGQGRLAGSQGGGRAGEPAVLGEGRDVFHVAEIDIHNCYAS